MAKSSLTRDQQFKRLCDNGLGFVTKAIDQLWEEGGSSESLKYSVINFYSGVELLLKARLMHEHWSLIVADPNKADREEFLGGEAQTVGLQQAALRLKKISQITISPIAMKSFDELRKHRNRMVHFYHPIDVDDPDQDIQRKVVILEQCRGWFYLRRLLADEWQEEFKAFQTQVAGINASMKPHREYLGTVYEQIKPELEAAQKKGTFLAICSACSFEAQELVGVGPQKIKCRVCLAEESFLLHECQDEECGKRVLLAEGESEDWSCQHCHTPISLDDVLSAYTVEGKSSFDDPDGPAYCVDCWDDSAATVEATGEVFCFNCFGWHQHIRHCEWCNGASTGLSEETYWSGCEKCEGQSGWVADD